MDENDPSDGSDHDPLDLVDIAVCVGVVVVADELMSPIRRQPQLPLEYTGHMYMNDLLRGNPQNCMNILTMDRRVFRDLCRQLNTRYGLERTRKVSFIEIVGMFIYTVAHGVGNRVIKDRFKHSRKTVSRQFRRVLNSLLRMSEDIIKPRDPTFSTVPRYIAENQRYFPYFKDCIGAIDGTHIPTVVSSDDRTRFIGRKGIVSQNVMAVCDFDMLFTFVYAGWEGSAHDSRIFQEVLAKEDSNFPHPPPGKYYLVDSGYPNQTGYLAPYRGHRYHHELFRNGPDVSSPREAFNYYHSSLRSVIERSFDVLKAKWHILTNMPSYPFDIQVKLVVACMAIHNFVRLHEKQDPDFVAYSDENIQMNLETIASTSGGGASTSGNPWVYGEDMDMAVVRDMIVAEVYDH